MFWSRIGFTQDPTRLDTTGKPLFYDRNFSQTIKTNDAFERVGVKIYTGILHNGWIGVDKYDYRAVDMTLDSLLKGQPDRFYVPRIKLNVPIEWANENPEELFVCFNGPRDKEGIARLSNKMSKWFTTDGWSENTADDEGRVGLQSFTSQKWKKDAGEALVRLLKHLETGPYAKRIIAYHIAFGACGESTLWGTWDRKTELKGDFGINHRRVFYDWCIRRYGSLEKLRKVWGEPDLSFDNFGVPSPYKMKSENTTLEAFFRAGKQNQSCTDYSIFTSQMTADAIEYFGKITKETTGGKPVGSFYGYLFTQNIAHAGHLAIDQLLNSPYIDFLSSPKRYYRCEAGWPGGEQTPSLSIGRKKIWIDELDNRTHTNSRNNGWISHNMDETRTVLWREIAKNLSNRNQNFWWMDLAGGWFDNDTIMNEISKLYRINGLVRKKKWESVSEILYVVDDKSFTVMSDSYGFVNGNSGGVINELEAELKLTGTPVDTYRLCDLEDLPLSQYKLIVFANAFLFGEGQWERIRKRIPETSTLIWHYAAGIRKPDFAWSNVHKVTGFTVEPCPARAADGYSGYDIVNDFPLIRIVPAPEQTVLDRYPDGSIMTAMIHNSSGGKSILCAYPSLKAGRLREIASIAGCHMYAPVNCTVYADNRFISVFPKVEIHDILKMEKQCTLEEQITGTRHVKVNEVPLDMPKKSAAFYLISD